MEIWKSIDSVTKEKSISFLTKNYLKIWQSPFVSFLLNKWNLPKKYTQIDSTFMKTTLLQDNWLESYCEGWTSCMSSFWEMSLTKGRIHDVIVTWHFRNFIFSDMTWFLRSSIFEGKQFYVPFCSYHRSCLALPRLLALYICQKCLKHTIPSVSWVISLLQYIRVWSSCWLIVVFIEWVLVGSITSWFIAIVSSNVMEMG